MMIMRKWFISNSYTQTHAAYTRFTFPAHHPTNPNHVKKRMDVPIPAVSIRVSRNRSTKQNHQPS